MRTVTILAAIAFIASSAACGSASKHGGDSPAIDANQPPQVPQATLPTVKVTVPIIGDTRPAAVHNELLMRLVEDFKADAAKRGVVIPSDAPELRVVDFIDSVPALPTLGGETLGYCLTHHDKDLLGKPIPAWSELKILNPALSPLIAEVPDYSQAEGDTNLRRIMYHELGHCLLNKAHDADPSRILGLMSAGYAPISDESMQGFDELMDSYLTPSYLKSVPDRK